MNMISLDTVFPPRLAEPAEDALSLLDTFFSRLQRRRILKTSKTRHEKMGACKATKARQHRRTRLQPKALL